MPESLVRQIKIMISSTRGDLAQYREEASKVIKKIADEKEKRVQLVELSMEKETQSGDRELAVSVSKRWVEESDWVVLIVGWNYGTIPDDSEAAGLSVTEWEYRHACSLGKKLFVFIPGEPYTPNQYRASDEREDLKDWKEKQSEKQKEMLKSFKEGLCRQHVEIFSNLATFIERLEKTLKNALDDLPPEIQPGTPLAELIVEVLPEIRDCIRKITSIANCKRTHDYLHDLRQHLIRPLREEVLSVWKQEGTLSAAREKAIWRCMNNWSKAIGGLRAVRPAIGPDHQGLRYNVDAILQQPALWNMEIDSSDPPPSVDAFAEAVENFAVCVQEAFSEADGSMQGEEGDLRERYLVLLEELKKARQKSQLSSEDQKRLDEELKRIDTNRNRVSRCLVSHHKWQEAHDKLEELDAFREGESFQRKLNQYVAVLLPKLLLLVEDEMKQCEELVAGRGAAQNGGVPCAAQVTAQAPMVQDPCEALADDLRSLKASLEALLQGGGIAAFDSIRSPFDDAFYHIDKRTIAEVEDAQERAVKLEDWLDALVSAQKKTT